MLHEELLNGLKEIKQYGPLLKNSGICLNVPNLTVGLLKHLFKYWPKRSDFPSYPVPSGTDEYGAYIAYTQKQKDNKWNSETQYGRDRWELLDFLIEFLEDCSVYVVTSGGVYPHEEFDHTLTADFRRVLVKNSLVPDTGVDDILEPVWASGESSHPCAVFVWS